MSYYAMDYFATLGRDPKSKATYPQDFENLTEENKSWKSLFNAKYATSLLSRYPEKDHSGIALPGNELSTFIFPAGLSLKYSSKKQFPIPVYFPFVFTNEKGSHLYAACLKFYEKMDQNEFLTTIPDTNLGLYIVPDEVSIYTPKVICCVSTQPFYRAMRCFLSQIYSMSLSQLPFPLEFYISSLISFVPQPVPGGRPFHFIQDAGLISYSSKSLPPVIFHLPPLHSCPFLDLDFSGPLRCLSVANMLVVLVLMLRESKMVFTCSSNNMLTEVMETLRYLLFPLNWSTTYVSRLPHSLTGLFDALGGFMIGYNLPETACDDETYDWIPLTEPSETGDYDWIYELAPYTYVVDLTSNRIYVMDGSTDELTPVPVEDKSVLVSTLPVQSFKRIQERLTVICRYHSIGPQKSGFEAFDSAFKIQNPVSSNDDVMEEFPTEVMRDMFLVMMVEILGDYNRHIIPPPADLTADVYRTFEETFAIEDYISSAEPNVRPLLSALVDTQMFIYFIQQRCEGSDPKIVYFERIASILRETGIVPISSSKSNQVQSPASPDVKPQEILVSLHNTLEADQIMRKQYALQYLEDEYRQFKRNFPHQLGVASGIYQSLSANRKKAQQGPSGLKPFTPISMNVKYKDYVECCISIRNREEADEDGNQNTRDLVHIQRRRSELIVRTVEDLSLHDIKLGPLIIPGLQAVVITPTLMALIGEASDVVITVKKQAKGLGDYNTSISYPDGWPVLRPELFDYQFKLTESSSPTISHDDMIKTDIFPLTKILKQRMEEINIAAGDIGRLLRHEDEKPPFYYRACSPIIRNLEANAVVSALLDIYGTSLFILTLRAMKQIKPINDVSQMLGILAELEDRNVLMFLDEVLWRGIFLSCASGGGSFMRQVAWTVYDTMTSLHVPCNSITYGAFLKAVQAVKVNRTSLSQGRIREYIDQYLYLEEMGLAWLLQRYALGESIRHRGPSPHRKTISRSSSPNRSIFRWGFRSRSRSNTVSEEEYVSCTDAASYSSTYLSLEKTNYGVICCHQPRGFLYTSAPLHGSTLDYRCQSTSSRMRLDRLLQDLVDRLEKLQAETAATMYASALEQPAVNTPPPAPPKNSLMSLFRSASKIPANKVTPDTSKAIKSSGLSSMLGKRNGDIAILSQPNTSSNNNANTESNNVRSYPTFSDDESDFSDESGDVQRRQISGDEMTEFSDANNTIDDESDEGDFEGSVTSKSTGIKTNRVNRNLAAETASVASNRSRRRRNRPRSMRSISSQQSSISHKTNRPKTPVNIRGNETELDDAIQHSLLTDNSKKHGPLDSMPEETNPETPNEVTPSATWKSVGERSPAPKSPPRITKISIIDDKPPPTNNSISIVHVNSSIKANDNLENSKSSGENSLGILSSKRRLSKAQSSTYVVELQERLLSALRSDLSNVIGIFSRTECTCGFSLLDDEMIALTLYNRYVWPFNTEGNKTSIPNWNVPNKSHFITCAQCSISYQPTLHVRMYTNHSSARPTRTPSEIDLAETLSENVRYISPRDVRCGLETLTSRIGDRVIDPFTLHNTDPTLYWNLLWYAARAGVPSGFLATDSSRGDAQRTLTSDATGCPIVIAWREDVLRAKARNLFAGLHGGDLSLHQIFPAAGAETLADLRDVAQLLDGSLHNMKRAMLLYRKHSYLLRHLFRANQKNDFQDNGWSGGQSPSSGKSPPGSPRDLTAARELFIGLLYIAHFFKKSIVMTALTPGAEDEQSKEIISFPKCFLDTVRLVLTVEDLNTLKLMKKELIECVSSEAVQTVRQGFGLLF